MKSLEYINITITHIQIKLSKKYDLLLDELEDITTSVFNLIKAIINKNFNNILNNW